jgi:hypothetical protein
VQRNLAKIDESWMLSMKVIGEHLQNAKNNLDSFGLIRAYADADEHTRRIADLLAQSSMATDIRLNERSLARTSASPPLVDTYHDALTRLTTANRAPRPGANGANSGSSGGGGSGGTRPPSAPSGGCGNTQRAPSAPSSGGGGGGGSGKGPRETQPHAHRSRFHHP